MKKWLVLTVVLALALCLCACGKSEAVQRVEAAIAELTDITVDSKDNIELAEEAYNALSEEDKADVENYMDLLTARKEYEKAYEKAMEEEFMAKILGAWKNANDGDAYILEAEGVGKHDDVAISYTVDMENKTVSIVEGVSSVQGKVFSLDESGAYVRLIPQDENCYYVMEKDFEEVSKLVQAETQQVLMTYEWWKSTKALNYISFLEGGGGWFLLTDFTANMHWEFVDNNTVKLSVTTDTTFTLNLDVVNENGDLKLLNSSTGEVTYVPKQ